MTSATGPIDVVMATDASYLPWCATAVMSMLEAGPAHDLRIHICHDTPLGHGQARLAEMAHRGGAVTMFHPVTTERLRALPSKGLDAGGWTSWIRIFVPDLLPDLAKAIYLDADTLVLRSIADLWAEPLGGHPLGAVANVVEPSMRPRLTTMGIDWKGGYFNAGVMVMDLDAMRRSGATAELIHRASPELLWFDQDALNLVFADDWQPLHPRWNAQNSLWTWRPWAAEIWPEAVVDDAIRDPGVVHFEGPPICKPWHYLCDHPQRDGYRKVLAMTPWRDHPVDGRSLANRVIHRLPADVRIPLYLRTQRWRSQMRGYAGRLRRRARLSRWVGPPRRPPG